MSLSQMAQIKQLCRGGSQQDFRTIGTVCFDNSFHPRSFPPMLSNPFSNCAVAGLNKTSGQSAQSASTIPSIHAPSHRCFRTLSATVPWRVSTRLQDNRHSLLRQFLPSTLLPTDAFEPFQQLCRGGSQQDFRTIGTVCFDNSFHPRSFPPMLSNPSSNCAVAGLNRTSGQSAQSASTIPRYHVLRSTFFGLRSAILLAAVTVAGFNEISGQSAQSASTIPSTHSRPSIHILPSTSSRLPVAVAGFNETSGQSAQFASTIPQYHVLRSTFFGLRSPILLATVTVAGFNKTSGQSAQSASTIPSKHAPSHRCFRNHSATVTVAGFNKTSGQSAQSASTIPSSHAPSHRCFRNHSATVTVAGFNETSGQSAQSASTISFTRAPFQPRSLPPTLSNPFSNCAVAGFNETSGQSAQSASTVPSNYAFRPKLSNPSIYVLESFPVTVPWRVSMKLQDNRHSLLGQQLLPSTSLSNILGRFPVAVTVAGLKTSGQSVQSASTVPSNYAFRPKLSNPSIYVLESFPVTVPWRVSMKLQDNRHSLLGQQLLPSTSLSNILGRFPVAVTVAGLKTSGQSVQSASTVPSNYAFRPKLSNPSIYVLESFPVTVPWRVSMKLQDNRHSLLGQQLLPSTSLSNILGRFPVAVTVAGLKTSGQSVQSASTVPSNYAFRPRFRTLPSTSSNPFQQLCRGRFQ
ncbi:hypothetical protein N7457_001768 [Penicillium paradoxum]|uniref:uncharacterized protein n=1 Tax=Penicillium paradoxum TaxID=176176 RepID=UPI002547230D|nr:uncharacterized protein N7457_001768 [Penicillium paradoxum]KAJ5795169.1 hypothetical protein N7457_001768 [Penicillium paradoxum]